MAVQQIPADVPISLVQGDELSFALRFSADLTGYTFSTGVFNAGLPAPTNLFSPSFTSAVQTTDPEDEDEDPVTTTLVTLSFVETQTQQLTPRLAWRWWLRWVSPGGVTRTVVSGQIASRAP
jgi:hypothetical protein